MAHISDSSHYMEQPGFWVGFSITNHTVAGIKSLPSIRIIPREAKPVP